MITCEYSSPSRNPEENALIARFVSRLIWGKENDFGPHSSMGVYENGSLIAGTIYHNWHEDSGVMEFSAASSSKRWLQPKVLKAMFSFPFDLMGAQMVVLRVSELNRTMISIAERFGFDGVLIPRLRGRDEGEWIFTLTDDEWNRCYIANRYRRK